MGRHSSAIAGLAASTKDADNAAKIFSKIASFCQAFLAQEHGNLLWVTQGAGDLLTPCRN
jgi:hypothetical protein